MLNHADVRALIVAWGILLAGLLIGVPIYNWVVTGNWIVAAMLWTVVTLIAATIYVLARHLR